MGIPLDEWSGAKATKELEATIRRINREGRWPMRLSLVLSTIAAIAALVAAWPVVAGWWFS